MQDTDERSKNSFYEIAVRALQAEGLGSNQQHTVPIYRLLSAHIPIRVFILSLYRLSYLPHGDGAGFEPATSGSKNQNDC